MKTTYVTMNGKKIAASRQSNKTLLIPKTRKNFPDSDRTILEDKYGHRYARDIELEQIEPDMFIFCMI